MTKKLLIFMATISTLSSNPVFAMQELEKEEVSKSQQEIENRYLMAAKQGDTLAYGKLASMYHYGTGGLAVDIEKAEQYSVMAITHGDISVYEMYVLHDNFLKAEENYLLTAKPGDSSDYKALGDLFCRGLKSKFIDFSKEKEYYQKEIKYYLLAAEHGDLSVYKTLGDICSHGLHGSQLKDDSKAKKYYTFAFNHGDSSVCEPLADVFHRKSKRTDFLKAKECYQLAFKNGYFKACYYLGCLYQDGGLREHPANPEAAMHWFIKSTQLPSSYGDAAKLRIREFVFPRGLPSVFDKFWNLPKNTGNSSPLVVAEVKSIQVPTEEEQQWQNAVTWLEHIAGKMNWKNGEYLQEGSFKTNARKNHKPEGQEYYHFFGESLVNASTILQKALDEDSFVFMSPKTAVQNHLITTFKIYNPLTPTDSDEVGLRLYNLCDSTIMAFGNENVRLGDEVICLLEGKYSLKSLIKHHQQKKEILERLLKQKNEGLPLDEEMLRLECSIFAKPGRAFPFGGGDPKPSFIDSLVFTLQSNPSISEEKIQFHLAKKSQGIMTNMFEQKMVQHIELKIAKRVEKIELLEGIIDSFHECLRASQPKKIARFRAEYSYLGDMFD